MSGRAHCDHFMTSSSMLSKVPQVTFAFWVIKILATTLVEAGPTTRSR